MIISFSLEIEETNKAKAHSWLFQDHSSIPALYHQFDITSLLKLEEELRAGQYYISRMKYLNTCSDESHCMDSIQIMMHNFITICCNFNNIIEAKSYRLT